MRWESVEVSGAPQWSHSAVGVQACPNDLMFVFGGASGDLNESERPQGSYANDLHLLDLGATPTSSTRTEIWTSLEHQKPPKSRCDAGMAYDPEQQRLVIFGGWGNRWFNDIQILDVANVVGPPYAISRLAPASGPNLGGTEIVISGKDFRDEPPIVVLFSQGNKQVHTRRRTEVVVVGEPGARVAVRHGCVALFLAWRYWYDCCEGCHLCLTYHRNVFSFLCCVVHLSRIVHYRRTLPVRS